MSRTPPQVGDVLRLIYETTACPICGWGAESLHIARSRGDTFEYRRCKVCGGTFRARLVLQEVLTATGPQFRKPA